MELGGHMRPSKLALVQDLQNVTPSALLDLPQLMKSHHNTLSSL